MECRERRSLRSLDSGSIGHIAQPGDVKKSTAYGREEVEGTGDKGVRLLQMVGCCCKENWYVQLVLLFRAQFSSSLFLPLTGPLFARVRFAPCDHLLAALFIASQSPPSPSGLFGHRIAYHSLNCSQLNVFNARRDTTASVASPLSSDKCSP
jgi:hypothetical protein